MRCGSNCGKLDWIFEKGTTPVCVSDLCSVKSAGAKTDPFTSRSSTSLSIMIQLLNVQCDSSVVKIVASLVQCM